MSRSFSSASSGPRPNSSSSTSMMRFSRSNRLSGVVCALGLDHVVDQLADFRLGLAAADARQPLEVQPVQQFLMNLRLQLLVVRAPRVARRRWNRLIRHGTYRFHGRTTRPYYYPAELSSARYSFRNSPKRPPLRGASAAFSTRMPARSNAIDWNAAVSLLSLSSATGRPLFSAVQGRAVVARHRVLDRRSDHALDVLGADLGLLVEPADDDLHAVLAIPLAQRRRRCGRRCARWPAPGWRRSGCVATPSSESSTAASDRGTSSTV